jgi:hypothetical protein
MADVHSQVNIMQWFPNQQPATAPQVAVKQLDVVMAEGALDCTIGGLTATAHAAADPVQSTALSHVVPCTASCVLKQALRHASPPQPQ